MSCEVVMGVWVDPPEGHRYGFPKLYDTACELTMAQWLVKEGYPLSPEYVRQWFAEDEDSAAQEAANQS